MNLVNNITHRFDNIYAVPTENLLLLLGNILSHRKIEHKLPVAEIKDYEAFSKRISNNDEDFKHEIETIFNLTDQLGLKYDKVTATISYTSRYIHFTFLCYNDTTEII